MSETGHDAEKARPTVLLLRPNYGDVENPVRAHALTPTGARALAGHIRAHTELCRTRLQKPMRFKAEGAEAL